MSGSLSGVQYANIHDVIKVNVIQIKLSINYSVPFCTIGDLQLFAKLMRLETKIKCCYKCEDFVSGAISRDLGFPDNEMISLPFNVD